MIKSELCTFVRTHVAGNLHILDHPGLAAAWTKLYVQKLLPPNLLTREAVEGGWLALAELCTVALPIRYQKDLLVNLQELLKKHYPKVLTDQKNHLCVMIDCQAKRVDTWSPACSDHTCEYCKRFISPTWLQTHAMLVPGDIYKSLGLHRVVHLVPRTMLQEGTAHAAYLYRAMRDCQQFWNVTHTNLTMICPGDLQPCAATLEADGYICDLKCHGAECIPRVMGEGLVDWDNFRFCAKCWPLNGCQFMKVYQHAFDPTRPECRVARVCSRPDCNLSAKCIACHKWWFEQRATCRTGLDHRPLCPECQAERLCCSQCKRLSWKAVPGIFFASRWIYGENGKPMWKGAYQMPTTCILCLPALSRAVGQPREEYKQIRIRTLLITWRLQIRAEQERFEVAFKANPRDTLRACLEHELSDREQALARAHPDFFWNVVIADCTLWDSTWWLFYQTARLPRDLFLIILRLVCFGRNGAPPKQKLAKQSKGTKI